MLSWGMLQRARRIAWACRPALAGAKARAYGRADRETFGISLDGMTSDATRRAAGYGNHPGQVDSGRRCPENRSARRVAPSAQDEAGRNDVTGRRRMWWEDKEE